MREYAVIYESGPNNWSAYVPDLPGCISTGKTRADIERNIQEAIELHIEGMLADGEPVPEPSSVARNVRVQITAQQPNYYNVQRGTAGTMNHFIVPAVTSD